MLKEVSVTSIFKQGELKVLPNYEPMSLLPIVIKFIEKCVTENNKLLCVSTAAFLRMLKKYKLTNKVIVLLRTDLIEKTPAVTMAGVC